MKRQLLYFALQLSALFWVSALHGSEVTLAWNPNTEDDLAGYKVYYGRTSQVYTNVRWVGDQTSYSVKNLRGDERYYFAVTAVDLYGNESDFSEEVDAYVEAEDPGEDNDDNPSENRVEGVIGEMVYNYPNPLRIGDGVTRIRYELYDAVDITIDIFDVNMNPVKTIIREAVKLPGKHTEDLWDGTNEAGEFVSNGTYFCRIKTDNEQRLIKIAVIR